jgi:hypothetical protein
MDIVVAATQVSDFTKEVGVPLVVAMIGLAGTLMVAILSFAFGRFSDAATRRREGYAAAQKTLVAYTEYAWRIRRRTSDSPEELGRLADIGHNLQQELSYYESWTRSQNRWAGKVWREVREDLASAIAPACIDAWHQAPVTSAAGMCLDDWGPWGLKGPLDRFESAVGFCFGWRRVPALFGWHPGAIARAQPSLHLVQGGRASSSLGA